jgi:hypothetical protein
MLVGSEGLEPPTSDVSANRCHCHSASLPKCTGRESNPHARRHTGLGRARLPVTPPVHASRYRESGPDHLRTDEAPASLAIGKSRPAGSVTLRAACGSCALTRKPPGSPGLSPDARRRACNNAALAGCWLSGVPPDHSFRHYEDYVAARGGDNRFNFRAAAHRTVTPTSTAASISPTMIVSEDHWKFAVHQ